MSEYIENILITEIEEVKEQMCEQTDSLTRERLELSLNLNELNNKHSPSDILSDREVVYEDSLVKIYSGYIKENYFNRSCLVSNSKAAENRVKNIPNPERFHLMWTKDFLDE